MARFKAAYAAGLEALKQSKAVALKSAEELEEPIPEAILAQLQCEWQETYSTVLDPHLEPADALRGRVWREFTRRTMTVLEVKKIKSLLHQSTPMASETVKLQNTSKGATSRL